MPMLPFLPADLLASKPPVVQQPTDLAIAALDLTKPRVGFRVGLGNWDGTAVAVGADVTLRVPFIRGIRGVRFEAEYWTRLNDLGRENGTALSGSLVFPLSFLGYFGVGPSLYRSEGDSGLGARLFVGTQILRSPLFVEAGTVLGPRPAPFIISLGMRY